MVTHYNYIKNKLQTQSELREGLLSKFDVILKLLTTHANLSIYLFWYWDFHDTSLASIAHFDICWTNSSPKTTSWHFVSLLVLQVGIIPCVYLLFPCFNFCSTVLYCWLSDSINSLFCFDLATTKCLWSLLLFG